MESRYDFSDPVAKTEFQRELAVRLCRFDEALERENYIEAVAVRYNIRVDDVRRLVSDTAAKGLAVKPLERPRSGRMRNSSEDPGKKNQRLLLTWLADEPAIFPKVRAWISPEDFSDDLYRSVAKELFAGMESGNFSPASILDGFTEEEEHRQIAEMFNTNLVEIETPDQRRKAFRDIIYAVKHSGYERLKKEMKPDDPEYLTRTIQGKKELEKLAKTDISPDD